MAKSRWNKDTWVSLAPNGIGQIKPNHYLEIGKTMWRNKSELPFAWRILTQRGLRRLRAWHFRHSRLHDGRRAPVHGPAGSDAPEYDACTRCEESSKTQVELARMSAAELRELGRLPYPMIRKRGDAGFTRVTWDEAIDLVAGRFAQPDPQRMAFYLTSRGLTNEPTMSRKRSRVSSAQTTSITRREFVTRLRLSR